MVIFMAEERIIYQPTSSLFSCIFSARIWKYVNKFKRIWNNCIFDKSLWGLGGGKILEPRNLYNVCCNINFTARLYRKIPFKDNFQTLKTPSKWKIFCFCKTVMTTESLKDICRKNPKRKKLAKCFEIGLSF